MTTTLILMIASQALLAAAVAWLAILNGRALRSLRAMANQLNRQHIDTAEDWELAEELRKRTRGRLSMSAGWEPGHSFAFVLMADDAQEMNRGIETIGQFRTDD